MNSTFTIAYPWRLAFLLWLATLSLGTGIIALGLTAFSDYDDNAAPITLVAAMFTTMFSWPVVPFAVVIFGRLLALPRKRIRLIAMLAAVTGFWVLACILAGTVMNGGSDTMLLIVGFATPYYLSALIATVFIYRTWLLRPDNFDVPNFEAV